MKRMAVTLSLSLIAGLSVANGFPDPATNEKSTEALQAEIEALKVGKIAWREIAWKSCLLEGLAESRAKHKPALLWVFIDRPVDDARC
jgi:hypothetical protein